MIRSETILHQQLKKFGVADEFVFTDPSWPTPVTFCAIKPPDDFPLYFYRQPTAPDLQLERHNIPVSATKEAQIFWFTITGLCQEPSRDSHLYALEARPKSGLAEGQHTIVDLDYRPMFWGSAAQAREQIELILPQVTVAIGNAEECAVAVGTGTPDEQADRLLAAGVQIAVVKLGASGALAKTATERVISAPRSGADA